MQTPRLIYIVLAWGIISSICSVAQPPIVETELPIETPEHQVVPTQAATSTTEARTQIPTVSDTSQPLVERGIAISIPRTRHTATLLPNGKILVLGGSTEEDDFVLDEELIDPTTRAIKWIAPMHTPRHGHSATLLQDGRILVVGGYNLLQQWLADAEVYDPRSDTWEVFPPLHQHGTAHTATLLKDGRVLVVGGCIGGGICTNQAELFHPRDNQWSDVPALESQRWSHTAQLLDNGHVLIVGGATATGETPSDGSALLFDPDTNTWRATNPMAVPRFLSESVKLSNGKVLVAGGLLPATNPPQVSEVVELYDPTTDTWQMLAGLHNARYAFNLITMPHGQVLVVNGSRDWEGIWNADSYISEIELYDPSTDQWQVIGDHPQPGAYASAVRFSTHQVWIAGGQIGEWVLTDAWIINLPDD